MADLGFLKHLSKKSFSHLYLCSFSLSSSLFFFILSLLFAFIFSLLLSCFFSFLVFSLLFSRSSLLLSLIFSLLSPLVLSRPSSFIFSCLLVLSSLFLCLSLSLSLCLSLCLCLRVMLCVVLCGACRWSWRCWWSWCVCVCLRVLRHRLKTPPCVHSERLRVYQHHAHMCFNMSAWCRYTRGRFESTHGDVLNGHTEGKRSSPVLLTRICRVWLSRASEVHQRNFWIFPIFKFENRLRTTCPRFLQSFALPDKAVQFQQS